VIASVDLRLLVDTAVAERDRPADPQALAFGGRVLVPDPLPAMTSRSNWAKERRTLSVSRPVLEVVLKD